MAIFDTISSQIKDAMRARDKQRLTALRSIRTVFIESMKETGVDTLDDATCVAGLRKLAKQRKESISAYESGGRDDLVAEEAAELAIIEEFLPQLADAGKTREWVTEAITSTGASSPGDLGRVMGHLMKNHRGEIDGKLANTIAQEILT